MNATRFSILGALAASLLLVPACDDKKDAGKDAGKADEGKADAAKKEEANKKEANPEEAKAADGEAAAPQAGEPGEPADGEAPEAAADGDADGAEPAGAAEVGVAVCDEYLQKYGKCIDEHAPDNMKTQMKDALAKSAERFKAQSEGPEKDSLEQSCTAALEAVKKTSKGWGCTYD